MAGRSQEALYAEQGNVTRAAKRLGLHRNQLRRWLDKNQVAVPFLEESWSRNVILVLASPLTATEYLAGATLWGLTTVGVGWVLCNELATSRMRSFIIPLLGNLTWVTGYCIVGVIAMYFPDWRHPNGEPAKG